MPSAGASDASGPSWQHTAAQCGNVYVQPSPVASMHNVYVQGHVAFDAHQVNADSGPDGTIYAAAGVPRVPATTAPGSTAGSSTAPAALGKDLLQDRAQKLRAVPKSMGSKSKRQQFLEQHGFKKPRGGKCRDYYGSKFGRDW